MTSTIYDYSYQTPAGDTVSLEQYRGKPLLIVNTATKCGLAPQFRELQALHETYAPEGLVVLGFPCSQFAGQEPLSNAELESACELNFGVTFPLSEKIDVNGSKTHPIFKYLKSKAGGFLNSGIKWNFTKFLVAPDGKNVTRFAPNTSPMSMESEIKKVLHN
ncbi:MAG: glutathione peroxidase [Candidatus Nanopelagicales bacterium]